MTGILYGVGVGPGDPQLLTLKAYHTIKKCTVIAVPGENPKESVAYEIAKGAYPEIACKQLVGIPMPMTKDVKVLEKSHRDGVKVLQRLMDQGEEVAFLTLGDPTVYSTYLYLHKGIQKLGYETQIISGIPSFCAAAARFQIPIGEKAEEIHVIPASYQIEEALKLPGTKILMKAGRQLPEVKQLLKQNVSGSQQVYLIENCGMPEERMYFGVDQIPEDSGYYTLIFIKEQSCES